MTCSAQGCANPKLIEKTVVSARGRLRRRRETYLWRRVFNPSVDPAREFALAQELCAGATLLRRLDKRLQAAAVVVLDRVSGPGSVVRCWSKVVVRRRDGPVRGCLLAA